MRGITQHQEKVAYIIAGSTVSMMEDIVKNNRSPFFAQFRIEKIEPFTKEVTYEFARTIFNLENSACEDDVLERIYGLSYGHPYYIHSICFKACESGQSLREKVNLNIVNNAFLESTLQETGKIYLLCEYMYNNSLSLVKGETMLKGVLKVLAKEEGLTLSQIARELNKTPGEVNNYLKSLLESGLIIRQDKGYYFRDPILRFWLANTTLGIDASELKIIGELTHLEEEKGMKILQNINVSASRDVNIIQAGRDVYVHLIEDQRPKSTEVFNIVRNNNKMRFFSEGETNLVELALLHKPIENTIESWEGALFLPPICIQKVEGNKIILETNFNEISAEGIEYTIMYNY